MVDTLLGGQATTTPPPAQEVPAPAGIPTVEATPPQEPATEPVKTEDTGGTQESTEQGEQTAEGDATQEAAVPEKYELKYPDTFSDDIKQEVETLFKSKGINQETAQELINLQEKLTTKINEGIVKEWEDEAKNLRQQSLKQLGPDPAKELSYASRFLTQFGSPELTNLLNETSLGDHPALVLALVKAGKAITETKVVDSNTSGSEVKDAAKVLYPNMN